MGLFGGGNTSSKQTTNFDISSNNAAGQDNAVTTSGDGNFTVVNNQDLSADVVSDALGFGSDAVMGAYATQRAAGDNVLAAQQGALDTVGFVVSDALGFGADALAANSDALNSAFGFGGDALSFADRAADRAAFSQSDALGFAGDAAASAAAAQSDALQAVQGLAGDQVDNISQLARDLKAGDSKLMLKALYAVGAVLMVMGVAMVVK